MDQVIAFIAGAVFIISMASFAGLLASFVFAMEGHRWANKIYPTLAVVCITSLTFNILFISVATVAERFMS